MGQKDLVEKRYFSNNTRYADLINGFVFEGQQVIGADDLSENDSISEYGEKGRGKTGARDLVRKSVFGLNFAIIGIENQSEVHYLMPLRVMEYDAGEYRHQAKQIGRKLLERVKNLPPDERRKIMTVAEYFSRFRRFDKLQPCVTFVLFYGEEWDGSRDLHGLLDFKDIPEQLKGLVGNYNMNLVEIRKLQNTDVFRTDLKQVFDFIRYSKDKKKLRELVDKDVAYRHLAEDAYDVAVTFTGAKELIAAKGHYEREGEVNMCEALTEMLMDERAEGRAEGRMRVNNLIKCLLDAGREKDIGRAVSDSEYQESLFTEYGV